DNVLIGGFILQGSNPKKVIIRALGPSTGIVGALANPKIELRAGDGSPITSNDNWKINAQTGVSQEAAIRATTIPPSNDLESALIATLPANNSAYTVIVSGADGGTGIGLVEVYDLDPPGPNISKLANISTRGFVGTNNNVLIGGFIISGPQTKTVVIRALGPSLANQNVPGPLANPTLELRNGNGDLLQSDDNFNNPPPGSDNTQIYTYSLQPPNAMESALAPVLAPGAYTAIVRGVNNTTGIALIEAYGVL
ncbi:MAG TPA: hypothetical protein VGQ82_04310, partial [Chthoniobacterales bacterium]|nr:hypothetical protein [Chthoniobacterales bacterium]